MNVLYQLDPDNGNIISQWPINGMGELATGVPEIMGIMFDADDTLWVNETFFREA